ncbi:Translation initiation factor IF-2, chloroplastic [Linum grandiflorum]
MASMVVLVGSMPSLASLVSFGSLSMALGTSTASPECSSYSVVRRISVSKRALRRSRTWHCISTSSICRDSVSATGLVADQANAMSPGGVIRGSSDGNDGDGSDIVLRAAPKPLLRPPSIDRGRLGGENVVGGGKDDDKSRIIMSLDEVLEKAEKLETAKPKPKPNPTSPQLGSGNGSSISSSSTSGTNGGSVNNNTVTSNKPTPAAMKKAKTLKSVWRKGDTVANVQREVKQVPRTVNSKVKEEEPNATTAGEKVESRLSVTAQPPLRPQPMLQAKPAVAPTPPPTPPVMKRPVILKDVGAAPKPLVGDEVDAGSGKSKERQTILVDKFARKQADADPVVAKAVVAAPTKPGKGPALGNVKFKEQKRRNASLGGPRRRLMNNEADGDDETNRSGSGARKGRKWSKASRRAARQQAARDAAPVKVDILEVGEKGMEVEELAYNLAIDESEVLGYLYSKGIKPDGVQVLDKDMVKMICQEYEVEVIDADPFKYEEMARKKEVLDEDDLDKLVDRPPVLTIMGHVDHGKTTLLDYIRKSKVAASEAGGITQGIGAYEVLVPVDNKMQPCVFLDTPGHEAFGAMRARGARVTDIAVIVVAADDGIRPQTNEAIAHAKAAGVPIVIAINKIDKEGANPDRVMQELSSVGLMPEIWGGDVPMVQISALNGENIDELLETVMLVAELQELKANPDRKAKGTVIEAGLHKAKGPTATFIIQNGTLKRGDVVVCGEAFGKARALFNNIGNQVDEAGPSIPVQVIGLNHVPQAGDEFEVVDSLDIARERAEARAESLRNERMSAKAGDVKVTLSSLASAVSSGKLAGLDLHQLNIILKVDLQGSIEAVRQALQALPQDNVSLKFLLQATGDVNTSDVDLAAATESIIFGFNVKAPGSVKKYSENKGVEVRLYKVIYDLIDDVRKAMEGLLDSVEEEEPIGSADVRAVFSSGSGRVAGCMVTEGKVEKGCGIKVIRKRKTVHVGILDSLRRVKEAVKEVGAGLECGIGVEDFDDFQEGDVLEAFNKVEKRRSLEEASASMAEAVQQVGSEL